MVLKRLSDVPYTDLHGYKNMKKQIVIGPDDGSNEIVLRHFSLGPKGTSPYHNHEFPHLIKIETGTGIMTDAKGLEHQVTTGDFIYINNDEAHSFRNTGLESLDFICIVPRRGEN